MAKKPRVAILSTGDEVVLVDQTPGPFQIRNSNSISLGAQVSLAGGEPVLLGNAADRVEDLRMKIETGLGADVLILSGGVSMGKYDLVETVLRDLGAEFYFDAVEIRPGRPAVFGMCRGKLVFGVAQNWVNERPSADKSSSASRGPHDPDGYAETPLGSLSQASSTGVTKRHASSTSSRRA